MKRSKFSLSNYKLLSCDMGQLVPVGLTEVLPGDSIQQATSALVRVKPQLAPVMHPVHVRIHHWFVPHRLVWDDWENFITGGPDGMNASQLPQIVAPVGPGYPVGSLMDYMGIPPSVGGISVSALPFRGYNLIWNEWYRDQDLQTPLVVSKASGNDNTTSIVLQNVAWEKDYFTTARPWTQKGPEVTIPMNSPAPVVASSNDPTPWTATSTGQNETLRIQNGTNPAVWSNVGSALSDMRIGADDFSTNLEADTTGIGATINELREAFAIMRYEEARARYGSRYTEYLRYLGVRSSDARLQRPEYLGGGKQTIQFSEVLQTAPETEAGDSEDIGVGNLKGHGIGAMRSNRYRRFFEEHGYIFTLMSVRPKTIYAQGIPRTFKRLTKEDFFQKELQHIGQQTIENSEIYAQGLPADSETFAFQDRYDEYRRQESTIAGEFRTTTLDYWHMARIFSSLPVLNASFVECVPTDRIYAEEITNQLQVMVNHSIQARRIVAKSGGNSYVY